jgi:hypothetical protein
MGFVYETGLFAAPCLLESAYQRLLMGFVYETWAPAFCRRQPAWYQRLLMGFVYETTVARMLPTGEGRGYQRLLRGFVYETDDTEIAANSAPGQRRYAGPEGECSAPK